MARHAISSLVSENCKISVWQWEKGLHLKDSNWPLTDQFCPMTHNSSLIYWNIYVKKYLESLTYPILLDFLKRMVWIHTYSSSDSTMYIIMYPNDSHRISWKPVYYSQILTFHIVLIFKNALILQNISKWHAINVQMQVLKAGHCQTKVWCRSGHAIIHPLSTTNNHNHAGYRPVALGNSWITTS